MKRTEQSCTSSSQFKIDLEKGGGRNYPHRFIFLAFSTFCCSVFYQTHRRFWYKNGKKNKQVSSLMIKRRGHRNRITIIRSIEYTASSPTSLSCCFETSFSFNYVHNKQTNFNTFHVMQRLKERIFPLSLHTGS